MADDESGERTRPDQSPGGSERHPHDWDTCPEFCGGCHLKAADDPDNPADYETVFNLSVSDEQLEFECNTCETITVRSLMPGTEQEGSTDA